MAYFRWGAVPGEIWTMAQVIGYVFETFHPDAEVREREITRLARGLEKTGPVKKDGEIWQGKVDVGGRGIVSHNPQIGLKSEARNASEVLFPSDLA